MKRDKLQQVSLDDRRRRKLVSQLIGRGKDTVANTIAWIDTLSADDQKALIIGVQLGMLEMVNSIKNLASSSTSLFGVMVRDLETRGNEANDANDT